MSDTGENYTTFNSRALVEVVGDVTDEALKATKIKQLLSVLAGRFFNWAGRKSLFTLHLGIKCCFSFSINCLFSFFHQLVILIP